MCLTYKTYRPVLLKNVYDYNGYVYLFQYKIE